MAKTVFILGAGVSKHAGAPLMDDFLDKSWEIFPGIEDEQIRLSFKEVFDAINSLKLASHHSKCVDLYNIESVFGLFEMGRLVNKLGQLDTGKIAKLIVSTKELIEFTLDKTIKLNAGDGRLQPTETFSKFSKYMRGKHKKISIITFNYDVLVDHALIHADNEIDYCLDGPASGNFIRLLKLHGSLNWRKCDKCGKMSIVDLRKNYIEMIFTRITGNPFKSFDLKTKNLNCHCGHEELRTSFIVPPTWNKTEYNRELVNVWHQAAHEMSEAENIILIGYSLPETDQFFKYLYTMGAAGNSIIRKFWVFDPKEDVKEKFKQLIGDGIKQRFRFFPMTFEDAVRSPKLRALMD